LAAVNPVSYALDRWPARVPKLMYYGRVLRTVAGVEFKLKYADSAMGYLWSLAKPLAYFGVLWLVFGHFLRIPGGRVENYPLYLLTGIVLYLFFIDAIGMTMTSIVDRGPMLRRIAMPPLVIPASVSLTAAMTFCVNVVAVLILIALNRITPQADWLLIAPLLAELYLFLLGVGLILATLFVRLRDVAQLWELTAQLFIFVAPIIYPISILPGWAQRVAFLNPFVQVLQDVRLVMLGANTPGETVTHVLGGSGGRLLPICFALATFGVGLLVFRREAPRFAERV
jgi:ABC-2 type transport system permease protein